MITFEHDGVVCESVAACGNSSPQGERFVFEAASEVTVTAKRAPQRIFQTEGEGFSESHGPCGVRRLRSTPGEAKVRRLRSFVLQPARAGRLGMVVDRGEQDDQLFLEVTAKNAAARW